LSSPISSGPTPAAILTPAAALKSEAWTITRLATPIAMAQFGLTAIGLVDVAVLGHASATDLGGASIGRSINFAAIAVGIGVASALEPLASQAVGANDRLDAWRSLRATLAASFLVWVPCAVLAIAATYTLGLIGVEPELIEPARAFVYPNLPGMLAFCIFLGAKSFLQAHERTMPSLVASGVANAVNVIVCNLLVRGDEALVAIHLPAVGFPRLGAFGAGLANTIATWVLALWVLASVWKMRPVPVANGGAPKGSDLPIRKVLRIGMPIGLQLLAEIGVFAVVAVLGGRLGRVAVSAHQIAIGLASFTFMGALGISGATAVRVGHAIGERRSPRAPGLVGIALGALFMSCSAVAFLALRRPLVAAFTEDAAVIELGASLLVVAAAFQLFDGVQGVAAGALRGAADVRFSFIANVAAHWLVGFPLAIWLGFYAGFGAKGLWIGLLAGLALVASALLWRFIVIAKRPISRIV